MSWRCELTGKTRQIGHRVSHSNRKTKRRFLPNLLNVTLMSDVARPLGAAAHFGQCAQDRRSPRRPRRFPDGAKDAELSARALELKRQVAKKRAAAAA